MKVLVVDDDDVTRLLVHSMVTALGHDCIVAENGRRAWTLLESDLTVNVVITDRMMPDMDGLELCRLIRERTSGAGYTYIVVTSGMSDDGHAREGMLAGADDYLAKPTRAAQLELKLIAAQRVSALHNELADATTLLRAAARRDPLTGLGNRLQMAEDFESLEDRGRRYDHRYSVALLDVDFFKEFNDGYGHQAGDLALQSVAGALTAGARAGDYSYRYGGEEFLCIFPEQSAESAMLATRRMLALVRDLAIPHAGSTHGLLTLSGGVSTVGPDNHDMDEVLARADAALYLAKSEGRNTAVMSEAAAVVPQSQYRSV